jgi:hypothetical protein
LVTWIPWVKAAALGGPAEHDAFALYLYGSCHDEDDTQLVRERLCV